MFYRHHRTHRHRGQSEHPGQGATNQNITITGSFSATKPLSRSPAPGSPSTRSPSTTPPNSPPTSASPPEPATGTRNITVTNPTGFGSGTCTGCFTVTSRPGTFTLSPSSRGQGATNQNITITGSSFQNGATVVFSGTGITVNTVTFNSSTQLTANISITPGAATGSRSVTVTNPDGGTRTIASAFVVNTAPKTP